MANSNRHLSNLKVKGISNVTNFRIEAVAKEQHRLIEEKEFRAKNRNSDTSTERIDTFSREIEIDWKFLIEKLRFAAKWFLLAYLEFVDLEDFMDLDLDQSTFDLVYYVLI